jgi:transcriptional regulator with AAA-type ATPase domain
VGGSATLKSDVRIIAATNRNLEQDVAEKKFREDLFYRLNVVRVQLPPLRQRLEDIRLLAEYFLQKVATRMRLPTAQALRGRDEGARRATTGPETCANWKTPSSARASFLHRMSFCRKIFHSEWRP